MHIQAQQRWRTRITTVAFISLTGAFGLNLAIGQFITPLMEHFGWSLAAISATIAVNMLTWGLFQPLIGKLIDQMGPRAVMSISSALMGLAYIALAGMTEFWQFLVLFGFIVAIGFAGCSSMPASVLVTRWHSRNQPKALAISSMGINAGQLLLLPLAGILVASLGWQDTFLILGGIMLLGVVPTIWFGARNNPNDIEKEQITSPTTATTTTLHDALRNRQFWLISLSFAGCGYTLYLFVTHMPKLTLELGGKTSTGGILMALVAGCSAISMWITGQWAVKKWSKRSILIWLHLARTIAFILLTMAVNMPTLIAGVIIFGISSFPVIPLTTGLIADRFGGTAMGGILGSAWLIHQVFAALGVFIGGALHDMTENYILSFASGVAILLASTTLTWLVNESDFRNPVLPSGSLNQK